MQQLDLFGPASGTTSLVLPGGGRAIETDAGAWRAKWTGSRYGWTYYRLTSSGWEPWEPELPFGQSHVYDRDQAEDVLIREARRYGDEALML